MKPKKGPYFASSRASAFKPEVKVGAERSIELAMSGDLDEFQKFIEEHPDMVNTKEESHGNVALHVACSKGNLPLIGLLLRKGAGINTQDIFGNTPLHYAIDKDRIEVVQMLIHHGCDVNIADYRGNSPLHNATANNNYPIVSLLLKQGADPDALDFNSEKPVSKSNNPVLIGALDKASELKINGNEGGVATSLNWMGFGIGLGVGLGMALAKQQDFYRQQEVIAAEKKKQADAERARKRREEAEMLINKAKVKRELPTRKLL